MHSLRSYRGLQKDCRGKKTEQSKKEAGAPAPSTSRIPEKKTASRLCLSLNPACSDHHFVKDCTKTSDPVKKTPQEEYRAKGQGGKVSALTGKETQPETKARTTPRTDKPAGILAELHSHRFTCRLDSSADSVAFSDTIVKYLGDKGFSFRSWCRRTASISRPFTGTVSNLWGKCKSVQS